MYSVKEGLYLLLIPTMLGLLVGGISMLDAEGGSGIQPIHQFEFTVWADTLQDSSLQAMPVISLSQRELVRASLMLLKNEDGLLPVGDLQERFIHLITIGGDLPVFEDYLNLYTTVTRQRVSTPEAVDLQQLDIHNVIIIGLNQARVNKYSVRALTDKLQAEGREVILVNFGELALLNPLMHLPAILQAPNAYGMSQELAAQALFGGVAVRRAPPEALRERLGISQPVFSQQTRLGYTEPEYLGISHDSLARIEQIVQEGIRNFAMPGCQVLVAHRGQVIYHQAFGHHTYRRRRPVRTTDLYDLASITKVAATTLASMQLYEAGTIDLQKPLGTYFQNETYLGRAATVSDTMPETAYLARLEQGESFADTIHLGDSLVVGSRPDQGRTHRYHSPVFDVSLDQLLTHTSGLQPSLPIYPYQRQSLFSRHYSDTYAVPVAERFYLRENYLDSLWNDTKRLSRQGNGYRYSCVNMILMQQVVDSLNQQPISEYLEAQFYRSLGLQTMCYNPREIFSTTRLVPTASDRWRGQLLCGNVHDPTAALLGGVSGNAGLFSNANDLAVLFQMLMNGGEYGGKRFLQPETIETFTRRQAGHRGYGFDKPPRSLNYLIAESASLASFGHTGFTGTCVWADPEHDLVYVFLSNRIHPSVKNYRLNELRIRQRVHQVVYNALGIPPRSRPQPYPSEPLELEPDLILAVQDETPLPGTDEPGR